MHGMGPAFFACRGKVDSLTPVTSRHLTLFRLWDMLAQSMHVT
jgi:hypothetical protein